MGEDQEGAAYFNTCVCSLGCGGLGMRARAFSSSFNCHYQNKNKQKKHTCHKVFNYIITYDFASLPGTVKITDVLSLSDVLV